MQPSYSNDKPEFSTGERKGEFSREKVAESRWDAAKGRATLPDPLLDGAIRPERVVPEFAPPGAREAVPRARRPQLRRHG